MTVPMTIEIAVASRPTSNEIRVPQISMVSTERPFSSVPSQNSLDGGSSTPPVALVTLSPSASASSGAASAIATKTPRMTSPIRPERWLRNSFQLRRQAAARRRRAIWRADSRGVVVCHVRTRGSRTP